MAFRSGQQYELTDLDPGATLTILHVEWLPDGVVFVHVRLDGLRMPHSYAPGGQVSSIHHIPFTEEALEKSVGSLLASNVPADGWKEAYDDWREAYELGEATVWTLPVFDTLQVMESLAS